MSARYQASLRLHTHGPDGRCVHIDKALTDLHPEATITQIGDLLTRLTRDLDGDALTVESSWIEIFPADPADPEEADDDD